MIDVCFVTFDHFGPRGVFQGDGCQVLQLVYHRRWLIMDRTIQVSLESWLMREIINGLKIQVSEIFFHYPEV